MQFASGRPHPVLPERAPRPHRPVVTVGRAGILVLLLVAACWGFLPLADARGQQLRPGPSAEAYPLAGHRGPALDPWGFVARQCTSYAAWYLNAHGVPFRVLTRGPGGEGLFTSARSWDRAAATAGFAVRSTPAVGSIAQWDPGESSPPAPAGGRSPVHHQRDVVTAGRYGHVAVVRRVLRDGAVVVSEYNGADGRFHVQVTRAPRYLYIGVPTGLE